MNRIFQKPMGALLAAVVLIGLGYWWFSPEYGETSQLGYDCAIALYSACNQQDVQKLKQIAVIVETSVDANQLSEREMQWLQDIIALGQAGEWKTAIAKTRLLMETQLQEVSGKVS
ncbi:hypothetical protein [Aureliella helgolandensis]|uniref:Uncharacterized protein n=1 Tax=Aureliella helgolandensis TaxID=2527968 RepID=A0A518GA44_9BACT|nr:hypothetical protein [Aureliella helgolandensis]QDV25465.1 hypothetical protein Q31a_37910 [Aureliella helgolandensis]